MPHGYPLGVLRWHDAHGGSRSRGRLGSTCRRCRRICRCLDVVDFDTTQALPFAVLASVAISYKHSAA